MSGAAPAATLPAMRTALSVAIVLFRSDAAIFARCVRSLAASLERARALGLLGAAHVFLIDNGGGKPLAEAARVMWPRELAELHVRSGHGNVGYGRGNNLVLADLTSDVHVVMNPDVELEPDAIAALLRTFRARPGVTLLAPAVHGPQGERQYLCRRYPSLWVLFLRGFAPAALRTRFAHALERYEMRDVVGDRFVDDVPLASGSFMAMRTAALRAVGGFDRRYFMYFEDYDLSLRFSREGRIAYDPSVRIVHHGGDAAAKGMRHIAWFARSAARFFASHGWRLR